MNSEILLSAVTYRQGNIALNYAFSGTANLNGIATKLRIIGGGNTAESTAVVIIPGATVFLPSIQRGLMITIKNSASSAPPINIQTTGGELIEGSLPPYALFPDEAITFIGSNGANWYIVSKKL